MYCNSNRQSFCWTGLRTLLTEDALCSILATASVFIHLDLHRTYLQAFPTTDALVLIALDANKGVIAHELQEHRYGADVLAEGAIVLQQDSEGDADCIIEDVARHEEREHGVGIGFSKPDQKQDDGQRKTEHNISDESPVFPGFLRLLI